VENAFANASIIYFADGKEKKVLARLV